MTHRYRITIIVALLAVVGLLGAPAMTATGENGGDSVPEIETFELVYESEGTVVTEERLVLTELTVDADIVDVSAIYDGEEVYNERFDGSEDAGDEIVLIEDGGLFGIGTGDVAEVFVTVQYDDGNYRTYHAVHEWGDESTTTSEDLSVHGESLYDVTVDAETEDGTALSDASIALGNGVQTANESGTATFDDVALGTYEVAADAEGYEQTTEQVDIRDDGSMTLTLEEESEHPLTVDLEDETGDPVSGTVTVDDESATAETAEFDLEDGEYVVTADASGFGTAQETVVIDGEGEAVTMTLESVDQDGEEDSSDTEGEDGQDDGDDEADDDDGETAGSADDDDDGGVGLQSGLLTTLILVLTALVGLGFVAGRGDDEADETGMVRYDQAGSDETGVTRRGE